jgi:nitroreductase
MAEYGRPITQIITSRRSCRNYTDEAVPGETAQKIIRFLDSNTTGPFGTKVRFHLVAAARADGDELKNLGSYGFIRNPAGFVVGATAASGAHPADFGFLMEKTVLFLTDLGLGTCWIGGSFKRSSFEQRIGAHGDEIVPAIASLGFKAEKGTLIDAIIKASAASRNRKPWKELFYSGGFGEALGEQTAGPYAGALEMARLAPSAGNGQPWRIVKEKKREVFHFFVQRSGIYQGYLKLRRKSDLQGIDVGIAMCHFQLAAEESGLRGHWESAAPAIETPNGLCAYEGSWIQEP